MLRYRTQGILAVGLGILATGCLSEPELKTNLRPEGPPEVLAVMAVNTVTRRETAAFCKYVGGVLDEKGPGFVRGATVCPDVPEDFAPAVLFPLGWRVRLVFDELLDPDKTEELICDVDRDGIEDNPITTCEGHINNTHPVTLKCGATELTYDGYYYPNGNKESVPLGPAIVVEGDADARRQVATGATCTISINDVVVDKEGVKVATGAQLDTFSIDVADLAILATTPADMGTIPAMGATSVIKFTFNANLDLATLNPTEYEIVDSTNATVTGISAALVAGPAASAPGTANVIALSRATAFPAGNYTARLKTGATFNDINGGPLALTANKDVRFVVE